jgi:serine/threonine protein kinase
MWSLIVEKGKQKGLKFNIKGSGVLTLGRLSSNQIKIEDSLISRTHCRFLSRDKRLFVEDLNSSHGTTVNFEKVSNKEIFVGDMVLVGNTEIWVQGVEKDAFLGNTIGGYTFHYLLGRGGQGIVYLAEQSNLKRICAVKVLNQSLSDDESYRNSFLFEARVAAALNHENLIGIYDVYEQGDKVFFSMEHMPGGSLADIVSSEGEIPIKLCIKYIIEAAKGLAYIHGKGFVHKDIKPANFMVDGDGVLKIGDFGITAANNEQNTEGKVMGSPHFMSPEHILKKEVDERSDLYSLGCSAYRMITGKLPFTGKSVSEIVSGHVKRPAPSFVGVDPGLNDSAAKVLDKLLFKEKDNRFSSAKEFISFFKRAVSGEPERRKEGGKKSGRIGKRKIFRRR